MVEARFASSSFIHCQSPNRPPVAVPSEVAPILSYPGCQSLANNGKGGRCEGKGIKNEETLLFSYHFIFVPHLIIKALVPRVRQSSIFILCQYPMILKRRFYIIISPIQKSKSPQTQVHNTFVLTNPLF